MLRPVITLILVIISLSHVSSQNKFGASLYLGMSSHGSDLNSFAKDEQGLFENSKMAYGVNIYNNINSNLSLGVHFKGTQMEGDDLNLADKEEWAAEHVARAYAYKSSLTEIGVTLNYFIFSQFDEEGKRRAVRPYVLGGFGVSFVSDDEDQRLWTNVPVSKQGSADVDQRNGSEGGFQLPIGGGLRFNLSDNIYLDAFYSARVPLGDYLDGISLAGNPDKNDAYQFCGLNIGFRFPDKAIGEDSN